MAVDDDRAYLEQIRSLHFGERTWTPTEVEEMRDFLAPWNHNIRLRGDIYTAFDADWYSEHRAIMDVIDHHLGSTYAGRRVLDLGCLEGYFSAECSLHGAEVVGVDAREINVKKCEFVKSALALPRLEFALDDAMNVTVEKYGRFDVVLALGLLYHLDDPFTFLAQVAEICEAFLVLDTLVALEAGPQAIGEWAPELSGVRNFPFRGESYRGRMYREYEAGADAVERAFSNTASHDNDLSVWLTEDTLVSLLGGVGFEQLEKQVFPRSADNWWSHPGEGRVLYVARRRRRFASSIFAS
jgi:SAM-dependent methyltransferase